MSRILIVEDHADIRRLIRMTPAFAGQQGQVEEAADGRAGLMRAGSFCPDVVLTDLMMPGSLDGLALCRGLKGDPLTSGAAVVMLTARGSAVDRLTARGSAVDRVAGADVGAGATLVKPFSPLKLIRRLEDLGVAA